MKRVTLEPLDARPTVPLSASPGVAESGDAAFPRFPPRRAASARRLQPAYLFDVEVRSGQISGKFWTF